MAVPISNKACLPGGAFPYCYAAVVIDQTKATWLQLGIQID